MRKTERPQHSGAAGQLQAEGGFAGRVFSALGGASQLTLGVLVRERTSGAWQEEVLNLVGCDGEGARWFVCRSATGWKAAKPDEVLADLLGELATAHDRKAEGPSGLVALGVQARGETRLRVVRWDVDEGGLGAVRQLGRALEECVGEFSAVVVPGSGRLGRFGVYLVLDDELAVERLEAFGRGVAERSGLELGAGKLEVYPAPGRVLRLPWGPMAGTQAYRLRGRGVVERLGVTDAWRLLEVLKEEPLASARVERFVGQERQPKRRKGEGLAGAPAGENFRLLVVRKKRLPVVRARLDRFLWRLAPAWRSDDRIRVWWETRVGPGERRRMMRACLRDLVMSGRFTIEEASQVLDAMVGSGWLADTRATCEPDGAERTYEELARCAEKLAEEFAEEERTGFVPPPDLSEEEVAAVVLEGRAKGLSDAAILVALGATQARKGRRARVGSFANRVFVHARNATGRRDGQDRLTWEALGGRSYRSAVRELEELGWLELRSDYVIDRRAREWRVLTPEAHNALAAGTAVGSRLGAGWSYLRHRPRAEALAAAARITARVVERATWAERKKKDREDRKKWSPRQTSPWGIHHEMLPPCVPAPGTSRKVWAGLCPCSARRAEIGLHVSRGPPS